jgi:uncharacterized membrane protein/protein-disulfide isomerase
MQPAQKKRRKQNIVSQYLDMVEIPHTALKLNEVIRVQPEGDSLLGISDALHEYRVHNISVKINESDLPLIDPPFIAHFQLPEPQFVMVTRQDREKITYTREDNSSVTESPSAFAKQWSQIVLIAEPDADSREQNYRLNRRREILQRIRLPFLLSVCAGILFFFARRTIDLNPLGSGSYWTLAISFLAGTVISFLLMLQTIYHSNGIANKICELIKNHNCNSVLQSPAAKLFNLVSWSDVGLVYFSGNLLSFLLVPQATPLLLLLSVTALPYTVWSVYHQYRIARQWCALCLAIQVVLWIAGIVLIANEAVLNAGSMPADAIVPALLCFMLPAALLWSFQPFAIEAKQVVPLQREINNLKSNENIFFASLESGPKREISGYAAQISFGEPEAPFVITMVTNPYCGPCADMHKRLSSLQAKYSSRLRLQTIYAVGRNNADDRNTVIRKLIAAHIQNEPESAEEIYRDWYQAGKSNAKSFLDRYATDPSDGRIEKIFESHRQWCDDVGITATPTIFVNGHQLPSWYTVEDLKYFIK